MEFEVLLWHHFSKQKIGLASQFNVCDLTSSCLMVGLPPKTNGPTTWKSPNDVSFGTSFETSMTLDCSHFFQQVLMQSFPNQPTGKPKETSFNSIHTRIRYECYLSKQGLNMNAFRYIYINITKNRVDHICETWLKLKISAYIYIYTYVIDTEIYIYI